MAKVEITQDQLIELQKVEVSLLENFIIACERLKLRYYLIDGTLLGAVRHQGFIPWDDDIDVAMPREDYEKFLCYGQDYLPKDVFLQTYKTDLEYPINFAKLRNSNTTFIEYSLKNCRINHGVYIDIFPLDYYPEKGKRLFALKDLLMKLRISDAFVPGNMKLVTKIVRCVARVLYPAIPLTVDKREKLFQSVKQGKYIAIHCGYRQEKQIPEEWYAEGTLLTFEGLTVRVPVRYHEWLTQVYGDYMQLPPEEKRYGHHFVAAFDLEKPYTYYLENG